MPYNTRIQQQTWKRLKKQAIDLSQIDIDLSVYQRLDADITAQEMDLQKDNADLLAYALFADFRNPRDWMQDELVVPVI